MTLIYGVFFNTPLGEWVTLAVFVLYVCILALNEDFAQVGRPFASGT